MIKISDRTENIWKYGPTAHSMSPGCGTPRALQAVNGCRTDSYSFYGAMAHNCFDWPSSLSWSHMWSSAGEESVALPVMGGPEGNETVDLWKDSTRVLSQEGQDMGMCVFRVPQITTRSDRNSPTPWSPTSWRQEKQNQRVSPQQALPL